jgi:hypothetical protein
VNATGTIVPPSPNSAEFKVEGHQISKTQRYKLIDPPTGGLELPFGFAGELLIVHTEQWQA